MNYPALKLTDDDSNLYLLIEGTVVGEFSLMLQVTDYVNNTWETPIEVTVYDWASKDCLKWSGAYEKDWTMCKEDFKLDIESGKCINTFIYW